MRNYQNGPLMKDFKRSLKSIDRIAAAGKPAGRKPAAGHLAARPAAGRRSLRHR